MIRCTLIFLTLFFANSGLANSLKFTSQEGNLVLIFDKDEKVLLKNFEEKYKECPYFTFSKINSSLGLRQHLTLMSPDLDLDDETFESINDMFKSHFFLYQVIIPNDQYHEDIHIYWANEEGKCIDLKG